MTKNQSRTTNVEEVASGVLCPDVLMPSQHADRLRRRVEHDGPRRLMIAIMEDAVSVYCRMSVTADPRAREMFREAEEWFESQEGDWLFSFEGICAVLGFDPEYIRRGLRAWRRRALESGSEAAITVLSRDTDLLRASGE